MFGIQSAWGRAGCYESKKHSNNDAQGDRWDFSLIEHGGVLRSPRKCEDTGSQTTVGLTLIKAARAVLTDDCIVHITRGVASPENVIKLMLEAVEKIRSSGANAQPSAAEWDQPQLWPVRPVDK
jgi:hypothetical protein